MTAALAIPTHENVYDTGGIEERRPDWVVMAARKQNWPDQRAGIPAWYVRPEEEDL